ncbi:MAG TPA: SusE domain-containing protein [Parafilimonas sp.]|nr:SusE domain-containing protein [Parafilimonas sp.]
MKTLLKLPALLLLTALIFGGCEKDETKLYFTGGTPPQLTAAAGADVNYLNADEVSLTLNWTNPDYTFTTGVSSMDVSYNIEIDTVGSNFTNPAKKVITVNKDLTYSFKASDLNDIMLNQLSLDVASSHTLEIRVVSSLTNNSAQLISNSVQYTATPYVIPPKVEPFTYDLFITGSATDGGWMVGGGVGVPANQEFTEIDSLHYTITVHLIGGQEYLFLPVNGDWGHKYACKDKSVQPLTGGDFGRDLSDNFPGPAADGIYKIDVDFQKGKYTVTKQ